MDVPLSLDTTNLNAIEAALEVARVPCIINSTSAEEERLANVPLVAKKFGAKLIALTMGSGGIPVGADERVNIALELLIPRAVELDIPLTDLLIDPLVLTVSGCQQYCPELIEAVRMLKFAGDPPPMVNVGLSNVSNQVPAHMRPLINNTYLVMLMAAGVDYVIANPLDEQLWEFIHIVENRDDSSGKGRLLLTLYDKTVAMGQAGGRRRGLERPRAGRDLQDRAGAVQRCDLYGLVFGGLDVGLGSVKRDQRVKCNASTARSLCVKLRVT